MSPRDRGSGKGSEPRAGYNIIMDPIDYVTGIGNAHSNQYKFSGHS